MGGSPDLSQEYPISTNYLKPPLPEMTKQRLSIVSPGSPFLEAIHSPSAKKFIYLTGRNNNNTSPVMTSEIASSLREFFPPLQQEMLEWSLVYSLEQHGISMTTLLNRASDLVPHEPTLLAIKTTEGEILGVYISEPPKAAKGFYGNGSCFLWKWKAGVVSVYLSTGNNQYFVLCEKGDNLAFGGGDGKFGLWIDEQLHKAHSSRCSTFDNASLASTPDFEIEGLELWSFKL